MGLKSTFRRILSSRGFNHPLVPAGLFAVTVLTTLVAGALQAGVNPFEDPWQIWKGIPFSFTLLLILGCHELGHWLASRRHGVDVSFPYFIPGPTLVGTFGAFIAMKSPISDRNALIDIGAAGPLAGLAVTIPVLFVGLALSQVVPAVQTEGVGIHLGECALFSAVNWIVNGTIGPDQDVILHPVAFAGWIGLLVTSLNLIPVGQLDGGPHHLCDFRSPTAGGGLDGGGAAAGPRDRGVGGMAHLGRNPAHPGSEPPAGDLRMGRARQQAPRNRVPGHVLLCR